MKTLSRVGGALYLIIIAIGLWGEMFVRGRVIVSGNAAATVANIRAHERLWRVHIAAEYFLLICAVVLLLIFYMLLRPVSRDLALLAVFFNAISIGLEAMITMYLIIAMLPAADNAVVSVSLRSHDFGFGVSLLFFGCFCIIVGYLMFKSGFFPKAIGVLMQIAGWCYIINTFALIAAPTLANRLFPWILLPAFVGELSVAITLVVGVRYQPRM